MNVDFEVRKRTKSTESDDAIRSHVRRFIEKTRLLAVVPDTIRAEHRITEDSREYLLQNVAEWSPCDETPVEENWSCGNIYVFVLSRTPIEEETLENENEDIPACQIWTLPSKQFHGQWESLHLNKDIKPDLLNFSRSSLFFAERGVDTHRINWNKVILLHGPPGTGKTSLCKALAQKLSIRLCPARYESAMLLEINAHSLFSKYFSESGKLVMKMFGRIREYLEDHHSFVVVLIDEVESLTAARSGNASKDEPSDAIRVVNSLLTQLDQLKTYPNALVMTTSNVTGKIDLAFVDRADMKVFIGLPKTRAIYEILRSSIEELQRCSIIQRQGQLRPPDKISADSASQNEQDLLELAQMASGLSGRALRKVPFLAHVKFIKSTRVNIPLSEYMQAMGKAISAELDDRADMAKHVEL